MKADRVCATVLIAALSGLGCNAVMGITKGEVGQDGGSAGQAGAAGSAGQAGAAGAAGEDGGTDAGPLVDDEVITISPDGGAFTFSIEQPNNGGTVMVQGQLSYAFEIDKYEVTVRRYHAWENKGFPRPTCAAGECDLEMVPPMRWRAAWNLELGGSPDLACSGPSQDHGLNNTVIYDDERHPMVCLNWYQAMALCVFEGKRLPTETEWMYVATNAGERARFPWEGTTLDCEYAVHDSLSDFGYCGFPMVVGSAPLGRSAHGLMDLTGSVYEWVWDQYSEYPTSLFPDYTGPDLAELTPPRVRKGGAYISTPTDGELNNWWRVGYPPGDAHNDAGFRCARTKQ